MLRSLTLSMTLLYVSHLPNMLRSLTLSMPHCLKFFLRFISFSSDPCPWLLVLSVYWPAHSSGNFDWQTLAWFIVIIMLKFCLSPPWKLFLRPFRGNSSRLRRGKPAATGPAEAAGDKLLALSASCVVITCVSKSWNSVPLSVPSPPPPPPHPPTHTHPRE